MFSGITQGLFPIKSLIKHEGLFHYTIALNHDLVKDLKIGASMSIDGVCQTVVTIKDVEVGFDAVIETLDKTTLNELFVNRKVSVERSIRLGDEIGGHEVSGHIFERGVIIGKQVMENNLRLTIQCTDECFAFVKSKGFIAVDGSSLTVCKLHRNRRAFEVNLIPETLRMTGFANKVIDSYVNLEPDIKTMALIQTVQDYFSAIQSRIEILEARIGRC